MPGDGQTDGCKWDIGGYRLDLSPFSEDTLAITNEYTYYYTPCRNGLFCDIEDGPIYNVMVDQINLDSVSDCEAYLAQWDSSITPTRIDSNGKTGFSFFYPNGQKDDFAYGCQRGRNLTINWICDSQNEIIVDGIYNDYNDESCLYRLDINSSYACGKISQDKVQQDQE